MKLFSAIGLLFIIACNSPQKNENISMPGAYKMLSQSVKGPKVDTTYLSLQQLKIYTDDYMMYANINPSDSMSSFGIGTFSAEKDTVTEKVIYSASDSSRNDNGGNFKLVITKTDKGYKQVIPEIESQGQKFMLTEEYESAGTAAKSPIDGAWKMSKVFYVKGKDTSTVKATQFKVYYAGHFIWGHSYTDSAQKKHTGMGFGKFEMNGTNKLKETVAASTYYQIRGQDVELDIEMNGNDEFKQTITNKDGGKSVEIYQRLKK